ncbi:hypothetical protein HK097_002681 [Rhizophlyctis rosea]|uniref:NADH dehydrogenase [ubiquinone] iron-sulfur protein 4, mitochondrial n=1 Tax=Rhizophlyctis rosea TaxID=64517 RepID=A0AAD5SGS1_9FUNG|nr:hypothetical protein HK097_002681 [Rhizophlyctis rosea]
MSSLRPLSRAAALRNPSVRLVTPQRSITTPFYSAEYLGALGADKIAEEQHKKGDLVIPPPPRGERKIFPADIASGVPPEISRRSVRIYRPAKTAMQSGTKGMNYWRLDFDIQERWENPLMGWSSSHDPVQGVHIKFSSKDDAILFAERQGYDWWVEEPKPEKERVKVYADNFKYVPGKLRIIKTK